MWDYDRILQYIEMLRERKNYEPRIAGLMEKLEKMLEEFGRKDKQHIEENKPFSHFKNNYKNSSNRKRISYYCGKMRHECERCRLRTKFCTICNNPGHESEMFPT